jgi:hypothetical protein
MIAGWRVVQSHAENVLWASMPTWRLLTQLARKKTECTERVVLIRDFPIRVIKSQVVVFAH